MIDRIINHIYAIFFVSLHENALIYYIVANLLNKMHYLKLKKENIFKIIIPIIVVAIYSNIASYLGFSDEIKYFSTLFTMTFFVCVMLRIKKVKDIFITLLYTLIASIVMMMIQIIYLPAILNSIGKTIVELNKEIEKFILVLLPARVMEYTIIIFLYKRKTDKVFIDTLKTIKNNKKVRILSIIFLLFNSFIVIVIGNLVINNFAFNDLNVFSSISCCCSIAAITSIKHCFILRIDI
jgi:hypothetical protein